MKAIHRPFSEKHLLYLTLFLAEMAISMNLAAFSMRFAGSDQMNQKRPRHPCRSSLAKPPWPLRNALSRECTALICPSGFRNLSKREQTGQQNRYTTIHNLEAAANILNFLTANGIKDMAGLEEKVMDMYGEQRSISEKLKPIDRQLKTLDEHISNTEKYFRYRNVYKQYKQQKPKKQEAFYEAHRMEMTHYEAAARYLDGVMNGRTTLPTKAWKAERQQLSHRYDKLKNEVKEVEKIRRNVYGIMREENGREQHTRKQEIDR